MVRYESKWNVSDAIKFQEKCEATRNKTSYLKILFKNDKPSIDENHKALSVNYLNELGLMFKGGSSGENNCNECIKIIDWIC